MPKEEVSALETARHMDNLCNRIRLVLKLSRSLNEKRRET